MSGKAANPRHLQQFLLPAIANSPPSLLHTVLMDEAGAIYYSDEFNNAVVSLDMHGNLRWSRQANKEDDLGFHYPRGLSLGQILINGHARPCLAVCDSWKHRVHILDLDGKPLAIWTRGRGGPFSEVTDVRFIRTGLQPEAGYWIVLDKGRHNLCGFGQDGRPLFEIGRQLPPGIAQRWVLPGIALEEDLPAGMLRDFDPFDFLFYPVRILGNREEALYICEASSWSIKQLLRGNFFPVILGSTASEMRWIDADISGLLGFEPVSRRLVLWDQNGTMQYETVIDGLPVSSNLPLGRFCTQTGIKLDFWSWKESESRETISAVIMAGILQSPLVNTALRQMSLYAGDSDAVAKAAEALDITLALADEFLNSIKNAGMPYFNEIPQRISHLALHRSIVLGSFYSSIHHWCIGLLEAAFLIDGNAPTEIRTLHQDALNTWKSLLAPIQAAFAGVQLRLDRIARLQTAFLETPPDNPELLPIINNCCQLLEHDLIEIREWIQQWCGIPKDPESVLVLEKDFTPNETGEFLCRPKNRSYSPASSLFVEVARFAVSEHADKPSAKPQSLLLMPEGNLLVSLSQVHRVVRMDESGKLIGNIGKPGSQEGEMLGPGGLALDQQNRLWISEYQNNRIQIFSPNGEFLRILDSSQSGLGNLEGPSGLLSLPSGIILAADYRNHRVLRISSDCAFSVFADSVGHEPEANWYPISFAANGQECLWLVDQGNHRIKKMRPDGSIVQIIGGCGLEEGRLFLPIAATAFEDGILAVAQVQPCKSLKLFSSSGDEIGRFQLPYRPSAMLARKGKLYVAGYDDDLIHIYELA